jgi:hypothetical protein
MSEWWTYSLSDFLLFSPRTYYRLFELYNAEVWPAHVVALALGALCIGLIWRARPEESRIVWVVFALLTLWVALAFHLERYATINWAATYFAAVFALEAALLLLWSDRAFSPGVSQLHGAGLALLIVALAHPAFALSVGRPLNQAEAFGIAPDPTAIATIGVLLAAKRTPWLGLVIPLLWLVFSTLTLVAMGASDRWSLGAITAVCISLSVWKMLAVRG